MAITTTILTTATALLLIGTTTAQAPGRGISKNTWAASDPIHTSYPWLMKYLPVNDADDSCSNNECTCGATGRVALKTSSSGNDDDESSKVNSGVSPGFGIHTVLSAGYENSRAKASGNLTVAQIEAIFDAKWSTTQYNPYHDHHLALYSASGLDSYITAFKADNVGFMPLNTTSNGITYYSILVHIPKTQVILCRRPSLLSVQLLLTCAAPPLMPILASPAPRKNASTCHLR